MADSTCNSYLSVVGPVRIQQRVDLFLAMGCRHIYLI